MSSDPHHLTLHLLWQEYREHQPDGYGYSRYCAGTAVGSSDTTSCSPTSIRAGQRLFVDYAGDTIPVYDSATGEVRAAAIFVAKRVDATGL